MLIVLDSGSASKVVRTDDFTTRLDLSIRDNEYECALVRLDTWYSWNNVITGVNDTLAYQIATGQPWKTITIPRGIYSVADLNDYIHGQMVINGDYTIDAGTGLPVYSLSITPDYPTAKAIITLDNGYNVNPAVGGSEFHLLLGFTSATLNDTTSPTYHVAPNRADISRGVNSVMVHVSCVADSYLGQGSNDIVYSFSPVEAPQSGISLEPSERIYLPVVASNDVLREIRVHLTDQLNRELNLEGEPLSIVLHIRKR